MPHDDYEADGEPDSLDRLGCDDWSREALRRLIGELSCCEEHLEKVIAAGSGTPEQDVESYQLISHVANIATNLPSVYAHFLRHYASEPVIMQLAREKMEQVTGEPITITQIAPGIFGMTPGVDVPDDLSGLDP